ncbi:helix-turn-helix transcriptional regulator [Pseudomaricurvus alkylphenolicus]|uniref:helix-turn-helix transcriptional regulator n=1 Tax=Pseudomaricurvus alkylphenolicus TaxID=1306991 RepID=UPI00141E7F57|nr:AraC family transcriptional regulator [Pseudomaricurvus alkylphenolicus]NIB40646.1 helix-turn-helix transcriptional regulator [Pseudomaricurvus alkylphenolicus]
MGFAHQQIVDRFFADVQAHVKPDSTLMQPSDFGVRYRSDAFDSSLASGYGGSYEISEPGSELVFSRGDVSFNGRARQQLMGDDMIRIRLSLVGEGRFEGVNEGSSSFSGQVCYLIDQPPGFEVYQVTDNDSRHCGVTLLLPRRLLSDVWHLDMQSMPSLFKDFEQDEKRRARVVILPLSPELASVATEVMQCRLNGNLLRLYLEGKAREIISFVAEALLSGPDDTSALDLHQRDVKLLEDAHRIIKGNYIDPPSIDDLAHQVGLNRNKLCFGFKVLYGSPIFEYCRELKLQHAMRLLQQGECSLMEIALQVGFRHAPAFSTAFKKRFGCSPKQFRHAGTVLPAAKRLSQ